MQINLQEDSFDQHGERRWTGFWLGNRWFRVRQQLGQRATAAYSYRFLLMSRARAKQLEAQRACLRACVQALGVCPPQRVAGKTASLRSRTRQIKHGMSGMMHFQIPFQTVLPGPLICPVC